MAQTTEHEPYGKMLNRQGRRVRTAGADGLLYEVYSLDVKVLWQRDEQIGLHFQNVYPSRIRGRRGGC